jgi:hypothetical protein
MTSPSVPSSQSVKLMGLEDPHHHLLSSLPASSQQICITPLTTTVPAHQQICLAALPTTGTTSSAAHQQICLGSVPAASNPTSLGHQQICLSSEAQPPPRQQIVMSGLPPVVAVPPPVTCQIACIAVSDVTSLTTSSQGGSLLRWDTVRKF